MKDLLKEADYKITTIKWLIEKGYVDSDAVLINELPVDNFNRRADLVVANGKLHAFEIKSDADSLIRLSGQIETYLSFFDKVTVVCSPKYTKKALMTLPKEVQILQLNIDSKNNKIIKMVQRGKVNKIKCPVHFLSFVEKKVLLSELKKKGLVYNTHENRRTISSKFNKLPQNTWRNITLNYLKSKYKLTHNAFFSKIKNEISIDDLKLLSPKSTIDKEIEKNIATCNAIIKTDNESLNQEKIEKFGMDISKNLCKFGFFNNKQTRVIPRLKK